MDRLQGLHNTRNRLVLTQQNQLSCTQCHMKRLVQTLLYVWPMYNVMEDCQCLTVKFCLCSQCPWGEGAITKRYITLLLRSSVQAVTVRLCISLFETRPPLIDFKGATLNGETSSLSKRDRLWRL